MTIEKAKELLPAIKHFIDGGNLWWYYYAYNEWYKQRNIFFANYPCNIIEDKHFEARKAYALCKEIEQRVYGNKEWHTIRNPIWNNSDTYRPKLKNKEPVFEWQYIVKCSKHSKLYDTTKYYTEEEIKKCNFYFAEKYAPSKRERVSDECK